jgi:hypothetical protein
VEQSLATAAKTETEKQSDEQQPQRGREDPGMAAQAETPAEPASVPPEEVKSETPVDPTVEQPAAHPTNPRAAAYRDPRAAMPTDPRAATYTDPRAAQPPPINTPDMPNASTGQPGNEPWRTSYEAFRANFAVQPTADGQYQVDWGQLHALKNAHDMQVSADGRQQVGREEAEALGKQLLEMGELQWEATLTDAEVVEGNLTPRLGLPPLPEPLHLEFAVGSEWTGRSFEDFKPGERVRFIAQITEFNGPYSMIAVVRSMESLSAADVAPVRDPRRR